MSRNVACLTLLEDDLNFGDMFKIRWTAAMSQLAGEDWAIFYAGHILQDFPKGVTMLSPSTAVQCSHFMLINGWALPKLVVGLEEILSRPGGHPKGGPMHVDGAYSTLRSQDQSLRTFASFPPLGYQRSSRSDVSYQNWFDRAKILRPFVSIARKMMNGV
jgi:glycosyl transferase family 25